MASVKPFVVFRQGTTVALLLSLVLAYPLIKNRWEKNLEQQRHRRDFHHASELDQKAIMRGYLENELELPPLCSPSGECPREAIYFDQLSAVLHSVDSEVPPHKYEVRALDREDTIAELAPPLLPRPLLTVLGQSTRVQSLNSDPKVPGIIYVGEPSGMPIFGSSGSCSNSAIPRLIRMSRAAVSRPADTAVAFITTTYCDGSPGMRIKKFRRNGNTWSVAADHRNGP